MKLTAVQKLYNYVISVERIANPSLANLYLMNRWDLKSTFTKINLWRQCQFRKIVYIDADVVALRAPDELFDIQEHFAAAPDVGWPDCFNSGVMVLNPNMADFYSLSALAQRGVSFDGADQGLLNTHFKNFHRISFRYNCTPSANYQYVPAYRHFESEIAMLHFIGRAKPWSSPSGPAAPLGSVYDELLARWWAVHDRHHRAPAAPSQPEPSVQEQGSATPGIHHVSEPPPRQAFTEPAMTMQDQLSASAPAPAPEEAQPRDLQEYYPIVPEDHRQDHTEHHSQGHHEYHPQDVPPTSEPKAVEWHPAGDKEHSEFHPSPLSGDSQHADNAPSPPEKPFMAPHAEWDPAKYSSTQLFY
jgi:lipopolysaccharide biosynthesis glycosyltransferase